MPKIECQDVVDHVIINPFLPKNFECTPNEKRPKSHQKFFNIPYVRKVLGVGESWLEAWPTGARYDVWCLDGGCWDRPTWKGCFKTLDEAVSFVKENYDISLGQEGWQYLRRH